MSLLEDIMTNTIDAGYAEAAARRGADADRSSRVAVLLGLVVIGLVLAVAAAQVRERERGANVARRALVQEVEARTEAADRAAADLARLRSDIARARRDALELAGDPAAARALEDLEQVTGAVALTGPGVVVTVDDPDRPDNEVGEGQDAPEQRVLDRDLQALVNGLWASGAEAISVNDQRLTALSAIRAADVAILVDYRPLVPPYVIRAVGDAQRLEEAFLDSRGARDMRLLADNLGFRFDVALNERLTLPAASGLALRAARPVESVKVGP
jgi:uncharacterized protein YlxW (UPF0749 family)